jgi:predicted RNA-binding protein with PUA-like domain
MNYWIVKQEPESYSWAQFVKEGGTAWTGVRNFAARNHLRAMKRGDCAFYYHSGEQKSIVGAAKVAREAYADPTAEEGDWSAVDLKPWKPVAKPVSLQDMKGDAALKGMQLIRQSRLSVSPLTEAEGLRILQRSETKL